MFLSQLSKNLSGLWASHKVTVYLHLLSRIVLKPRPPHANLVMFASAQRELTAQRSSSSCPAMFRKKKSTEKLPPAAPVGTSASATKKTSPAITPAASQPTDEAVDGIPVAPAPPAIASSTKKKAQATQATASQSKEQTSAPAPVVPTASHGVSGSPKTVDKAARKAKGARGFFKRAQTVVGLFAEAAEAERLQEDKDRKKNWKRWGPYLSERQWATVREDYSPDGSW